MSACLYVCLYVRMYICKTACVHICICVYIEMFTDSGAQCLGFRVQGLGFMSLP